MSEKKTGVVIADDEERICRLITALGEWDDLGMEVIGTASNGPEALALLAQKSVDILITDIRMPGLNGIELIEQAKTLSPSTRFIIISGFAEFTYAQQALHFGVEDYLLKPINKEQLNEALLKIRGTLLGEEARREELLQKEELLKTRSSQMRSSLIRDLLLDPSQKLTKEELSEKYDFGAGKDSYRVLCVKLCAPKEGEDSERSAGEAFLWEKVRYILSDQLKESTGDYELFLQNRYLYGLINYSSRNEEALKQSLRSALVRFGALKGIFRSGTLFLSLGNAVDRTEELSRSVLSAKRALEERFLKGSGKLLEQKNDRSPLFEKKLLDQYSRTLTFALENFDTDLLKEAVDRLRDETIDTENVCGYEMLELVRQAGNLLIVRMDLPNGRQRLDRYYEDCDNTSSAEELFELLKTFAVSSLNMVEESREDDTLRAIREAKKYLMNHYSEQITLEEVSGQLGLSAPYFSTLFKKETGTGFAKYLMGLRIEAAKELLRESHQSVAQICKSVGYNDVKHFTRNFEQSVGIKPAVYRKLYG